MICEREGLQGGTQTCHSVWFGDSGIDKKTGGGRAEDIKILIRSGHNGQD